MAEPRRIFRREPPESRKEALMRATLTLVSRHGPAAATVRAIAQEAGVTQGMIRHYFSSKEDLLNAAYRFHMLGQTQVIDAAAMPGRDGARERLARMIAASVTPPVAAPEALSLWAGFIHMVWRDPAMRRTHEGTYLQYRDLLQRRIADALAEVGRGVPPSEARQLAIACNAVLDGLWLEAGALPEAFEDGELIRIGLRSVGAILGIELSEGEAKG